MAAPGGGCTISRASSEVGEQRGTLSLSPSPSGLTQSHGVARGLSGRRDQGSQSKHSGSPSPALARGKSVLLTKTAATKASALKIFLEAN